MRSGSRTLTFVSKRDTQSVAALISISDGSTGITIASAWSNKLSEFHQIQCPRGVGYNHLRAGLQFATQSCESRPRAVERQKYTG